MKSVMKRLGDVEEILAAGHDVPANAQAEFFGEGHEAVENLGDTAAHGRGIDHFDGAALEGFGKSAQFFEFAGADDGSVIIEWNAASDLHWIHVFSSRDPEGEAIWRARYRACWCKCRCD